ncbi:hypothetical protein OQA88_7137 [Cercophora sp. LCS_1]
MGSIPTHPPHPSASSPSLILTNPTPAERRKTWSLTHPKWGPVLSLQDYLSREAYLMTVPLAKDGGLIHWILTDSSSRPDNRPIYSSCEALRKHAICSRPDGTITDGLSYGIGSVFTDPQYRGRGYAGRMMTELARRLKQMENVLFTVLYSDIGKEFYAKRGWLPYPSWHVAFPALKDEGGGGGKAKKIGYHELAELCCVDERVVRERMIDVKGTGVALVPGLEQMLWHLMREDYMTKRIFGRTPEVRGAVVGEDGRRVWAVWTRGYYGGLEKVEGNTMHVLRVVVEDEAAEMGGLVQGFKEIVRIAQNEACEWRVKDVQIWNPEGVVRRLVEGCGLTHEFVERENDSIPSLMWHGEGEVEWVANEKYGWC